MLSLQRFLPLPPLYSVTALLGVRVGTRLSVLSKEVRDSVARRPVRKLQCAGLPCGYEWLFSGEPICKCGGNLIPHGGLRQNGHITYGNGAWWPTGSKTPSTTPSPRHDASINLAYGIRLVAAPYAAQHPHLPQFPRDPGVCDYTPRTDAPAT